MLFLIIISSLGGKESFPTSVNIILGNGVNSSSLFWSGSTSPSLWSTSLWVQLVLISIFWKLSSLKQWCPELYIKMNSVFDCYLSTKNPLLSTIFQANISLLSEVEYKISSTIFKDVTFPLWPMSGVLIMSSVYTL